MAKVTEELESIKKELKTIQKMLETLNEKVDICMNGLDFLWACHEAPILRMSKYVFENEAKRKKIIAAQMKAQQAKMAPKGKVIAKETNDKRIKGSMTRRMLSP